MTGHAFAFTDDLMRTAGIDRDQPVMTAEADLRGIFSQQFAMVGGVGIMAAGAITLRQGGMDELFVHRLLEPLMATQTELSPGSGSQVEGVFRFGQGAIGQGQEDGNTGKYQQ